MNLALFVSIQRCGLMRDELTQILRRLELNKKKLVTLLPFLEFITWSLLKEQDSSTVRHTALTLCSILTRNKTLV